MQTVLNLNEDFVLGWASHHLYQRALMTETEFYGFTEDFTHTMSPISKLNILIEKLDAEVLGQNMQGGEIRCLVLKLRSSGALLCCRRHGTTTVFVNIAGATAASVKETKKAFEAVVPKYTVPKDNKPRIPVHFHTVKGSNIRVLDAAKWDSAQQNYPTAVREQLGNLMSPDFRPSRSGQLLLWHGLPGTGKTWALRTLGYEWRKWSEVLYLVDPEQFFGNADYMMNVLTENIRNTNALIDEEEENEEPPPSDDREYDGRWRLIIAEDTGELLSADAKQRTGQGLSRLLNVVDGMIGQGLRVMVLITTNEKLGTLHSAVTRPGRATNIIEFQPFTVEEANEWLTAHGREPRTEQKPVTLAELFNGQERSMERKVGFNFGKRKVA